MKALPLALLLATISLQSSAITIQQIVVDTYSDSEAAVKLRRYAWQDKPQVTMYSPAGKLIPKWWTGERPAWSYNVLTWFVAYEADGNTATNTRVEVKNLRFFVYSQANKKWDRFDIRQKPGLDLWTDPFTYKSGVTGMRWEADGGISMKPTSPDFFHGYGNSVTITPEDVRGVFVAMEFRLVVDNASKPDDRANAKYVLDVGGDYYPGNGQGSWGLGYAPGMGNGRMLLATPEWRTATMLVPNTALGADMEEMKVKPPPLDVPL
jgi:hypothetical protein